jgi:RNA polymerase sigma-70 factor (ECF subfamily)
MSGWLPFKDCTKRDNFHFKKKMKPEDELVEKARAGLQSGFNGLYEMHQKTTWNVIYNMVKNKDVADDLTATVFAKAFLKLDKYVENLSFRMWLKRIATNSVIDYVRRMKKEMNTSYVDDEECKIQLTTYVKSPEDDYVGKETLRRVMLDIEALKPIQRDLMKAKHLEDLDYKELCIRFNITESTVKTELHRAKNKLKKKRDLPIKQHANNNLLRSSPSLNSRIYATI